MSLKSAQRSKPRRKFARVKKNNLGLWAALAIAVLLGVYAAVVANSRPRVGGDELRLDTFVKLAQQGQVKDARLLDQDEYVVGRYVRDDGSVARYNVAYPGAGAHDTLVQLLLSNNVPTEVDHQFSKRLLIPATVLVPALIVVVIFIYLILSYQRGTGLFGVRSGARRLDAERTKASFADVAGQDAAVAELKEVRDFLSDPERFAALGARVPKGILLYGPPGCGKTLLARAVAGESGAAFYSISGSDFVELYVGVGAARVRDLFREAREKAPAVVFIDELDSIGRARSTLPAVLTAQGEQEQALNQILAEMDGVSPVDGIIVLAATNRPDVLDQALLRPGRFDRTIGLERPDATARLAILSLHAQGKRLEGDLSLAAIAQRAIGLTGADLASVVNEAALAAARSGKAAISQSDLEEALQRILDAPERQRRLSLRDRSVARRYSAEDRVTFADLAGVDDAVAELAEVKDYLASPERFATMGARAPRGILVSGPAGSGKTLLARAVAGEANAAFFSVAASEFVEIFAGEGASRVRDLFAEARSVAPAIVFIDEIDAIGAHRASSAEGLREREQTLNQILVELDGFQSRSGVIVMAATNRPDILDPALVRPGRFDRHVTISLPDRAGRRAILELHGRGKPLGPDVDLEVVAGLTRGFSGADLANMLNEAALLATRRGWADIPMVVVEQALDRAFLGVASRRTVLSDEERRVVAYHEAGHALVARRLQASMLPHKITIVASGAALGHCSVIDSHDRVIRSRSQLIDEMAVVLAGRVAEDLVLGEPASGGADDLRRAGDIARAMVCELGMSEGVGLFPYREGANLDGRSRVYSEEAARTIEFETRLLMDAAYGRAHDALKASRAALDRIAQLLLDREVLSAAELHEAAEPLPALTGASAPRARRPARSPRS